MFAQIVFDQAPIQGIKKTRTTVMSPNNCLKSSARENIKFNEKVVTANAIPKALEIYLEPK